jgi:ketosteroid isomerase-like protein
MTQPTTTDELSIWQLLCRYCHLVDRGDMADVTDLFHPEGTLIFPPSPPAEGREAIRQAYDDWLRAARQPTGWLRHQINTPLIEVDGDRATAVCYFTADFLLRKKGRVQALVGRYEDELVRHKGCWRFRRREIIVDARLDFGEPR